MTDSCTASINAIWNIQLTSLFQFILWGETFTVKDLAYIPFSGDTRRKKNIKDIAKDFKFSFSEVISKLKNLCRRYIWNRNVS